MFLSKINNRKIDIFEHLNNVKLKSWNFASKIDTEHDHPQQFCFNFSNAVFLGIITKQIGKFILINI